MNAEDYAIDNNLEENEVGSSDDEIVTGKKRPCSNDSDISYINSDDYSEDSAYKKISKRKKNGKNKLNIEFDKEANDDSNNKADDMIDREAVEDNNYQPESNAFEDDYDSEDEDYDDDN